METKKQNPKRQPMFADIVVAPCSQGQPETTRETRSGYMKLIYPNGVTLILPAGISPAQLMEYVNAFRS